MAEETKEASFDIQSGFLVIKLPLRETPIPSATGKTLVVASTHGNRPTQLKIQGQELFVGANAYIRKPR